MDVYKVRAFCRNGHHQGEVPFGDLFHLHKEVCAICGDPKSRSTWTVKTCRWRSTSQLLKPSTWNDGYWETPEEVRMRRPHLCECPTDIHKGTCEVMTVIVYTGYGLPLFLCDGCKELHGMKALPTL